MRHRRRWLLGAGLIALTLLATAGPAAAETITSKSVGGSYGVFGTDISKEQTSVNLLWITIGAAMVIFMQAGFALVETGFCRAKHAAHVVSTNFAVFGVGFVSFFLVGFGIMFGGYSATIGDGAGGFIPVIGPGAFENALGSFELTIDGWGGIFAWASPGLSGSGYDAAVMIFFLYMVAFMDTTATIPTGAMAERWKWWSFVIWAVFCGAIYYPLFGSWTWGGGWLSQLGVNHGLGHGYVDFAGSGIVHAMGGVAALAGAIVLGPRIGKFVDGKPRAMPGHHIPMAMLGTFILLFGWFGFNAASTFAASDPRFAVVATNTAISGAFGSVLAMLWITVRTKKPDPAMMANGMLAGLVAITAPCAFVQPWAAALIGSIAGVLVIESVFFVERKLKVDDPVGAFSVHGVNGIWGVLALGLFADGNYGGGWNGTVDNLAGVKGWIYGDFGQFQAQLIGALVIIVLFGGIAFAFFKIQNALTKGGIRPAAEIEIGGLDLPEMGVLAYPEFGVDSYDASPAR